MVYSFCLYERRYIFPAENVNPPQRWMIFLRRKSFALRRDGLPLMRETLFLRRDRVTLTRDALALMRDDFPLIRKIFFLRRRSFVDWIPFTLVRGCYPRKGLEGFSHSA
jgi:hypothetical protein